MDQPILIKQLLGWGLVAKNIWTHMDAYGKGNDS